MIRYTKTHKICFRNLLNDFVKCSADGIMTSSKMTFSREGGIYAFALRKTKQLLKKLTITDLIDEYKKRSVFDAAKSMAYFFVLRLYEYI